MHTDVCVIGSGTIGKAVALGLAQSGRKVTLLSPLGAPTAAKTSDWDVRVYALNAVAREVLTSLKVWDALDAARIAPVDAMSVFGDGDGERAGKLEFDAYTAHRGALSWIVEDSNLDQALNAALHFAPNITLLPASAEQLRVATGCATLELIGGKTLTAQLIVGADGANSWVRNQADIGIDYRPYEQRAIVSNFACSVPHQGIAHQWFTGDQGVIALLPLPGQRVSLVWSAPDALAETLLSESPHALAQRLSALPAQSLGELTPLQPERVQALPLALMRAHQVTSARLALVGDAAHAIHPLAGQGMNLGFADVAALLRVMADAGGNQDCGDARLLARYARARKEDVLLMQLGTDGLHRLFTSRLQPLRVARNLGMHALNQFSFIKRQLMAHAAGKLP